MDTASPKLFRVSQIPETLGLGETTVRKMIKSGELKAVRVRGMLAVTEDALNEFIAALPDAH